MIDTFIKKMFSNAFKKEYFETYWAIDLHGVVFKPNHRKEKLEAEFYPWAKKTLQLMTKRKDIVMIISSSSYPEEIEYYQKVFKENDIHFKYINENPDIDTAKGNFGYYKDKFYFNVMFEDKAGFDPYYYWKLIYSTLKYQEISNSLPDPKWSTKF